MKPFSIEEQREWHNNLPGKACGAGVVCINEKGQLLAVKATYKTHWSLPGGVVDKNESPLNAAVRELQEEVGITINVHEVRPGGVVYMHEHDGLNDSLYFLFYADIDSKTKVTIDGHEIEQFAWLSQQEFRERINDNHMHLKQAADLVESLDINPYTESQ